MGFSGGHLSLGAVADSDTEQVFKLKGQIAEFPRARASPIPKRKWEPIDPIDTRKFGYNDVTVRPYVRTNFGGGEGSKESALLGKGYTFASATFFRRETLLGNLLSVWREIAWPSSL